jgi:hypothetical protein
MKIEFKSITSGTFDLVYGSKCEEIICEKADASIGDLFLFLGFVAYLEFYLVLHATE